MHLILWNPGKEQEPLAQDIKLHFYLYLIGKDPLHHSNSSCLLDFTSRLYQPSEAVPQDALLLFSYFPLQV